MKTSYPHLDVCSILANMLSRAPFFSPLPHPRSPNQKEKRKEKNVVHVCGFVHSTTSLSVGHRLVLDHIHRYIVEDSLIEKAFTPFTKRGMFEDIC